MKCERCGECCRDVNKKIWQSGDTDGKLGDCEKLIVIDGFATCIMYDKRPPVCVNYPKKGRKCIRQRNGN